MDELGRESDERRRQKFRGLKHIILVVLTTWFEFRRNDDVQRAVETVSSTGMMSAGGMGGMMGGSTVDASEN
jgi:hypothetical protein